MANSSFPPEGGAARRTAGLSPAQFKHLVGNIASEASTAHQLLIDAIASLPATTDETPMLEGALALIGRIGAAADEASGWGVKASSFEWFCGPRFSELGEEAAA
jgi:hypothetical protein